MCLYNECEQVKEVSDYVHDSVVGVLLALVDWKNVEQFLAVRHVSHQKLGRGQDVVHSNVVVNGPLVGVHELGVKVAEEPRVRVRYDHSNAFLKLAFCKDA